MADLSASNFSTTDASNNAASPNGWTPGVMLPSQVEPTMQATTGALKRFWERTNCQITTTGASGAYIYAPSNVSYPSSIVQGEIFGFYAHQASVGNDTFKINGTTVLGPYNIYLMTQAGSRQIKANEIVSGQFCLMQYSTALGGMVLAYAADISSYSPAFSGIPTAPTAALGTNTNQIATMAALINQAFSSSLPAISAGVTDYFTTNNGSTGSWGNLLKSGTIRFADSTDTTKRIAFNAASITTGTTRTITMPDRDITLGGIGVVNSSITTSTTLSGQDLYVPVAMTALGQSITLPNATTVSVGGPHYIIDNTKGTYPVGIRDNTGTLLMAVAAGGEAYVSLKDNSTQAGVWSITGTNLEPGLITIDNTFSSTYASTVLAPFVALDNNTSIHFAALSSGFAAFVADNTGKALTTPVTVSSTASDAPAIAFKVSSTSAILFYGQTGTNTHKAVVLSISGSSPSLTLSVGTPQTLTVTNSTAKWGGEDFSSAPKVAQLSSTLYVASYCGATTEMSAVAVSVSGAVVTIGTPASILGASAVTNSTTTYALTATTALVLYKSGGAAPYANNAVVVSVSGTTCTVGTPAALANCQSSQTSAPSSAFISATKIAVADDNNTTQVTVSGVTISGTTVTAWTALNVETGLATNLIEYTTNSATRYNPHLWLLSAGGTNTFGCWYLDSSGISRAVVLTESSGTVTAGTILGYGISVGAANAIGNGCIAPQGTSEYIGIQAQLANTAGYGLVINTFNISGTNITQGFGKALRNVVQTTPSNIAVSRLSSGDYVCLPVKPGTTYQLAASTVIPVFRSNGNAINYRGEISCPPIAVPIGQLNNAVSSNRIVAMGISGVSTSSVAGGTLQLRLINVEIAQ